ncbi:MAG: DUF5103 domain-containing protein [Bacteroidetes bacterium]|nr:DUF5103 domain-containing protein [Bacteroidota bacterium]
MTLHFSKYLLPPLIVITLLQALPAKVLAQPDDADDYYDNNYLRYDNHTYKDSIRSVLVHKEGWILTYPVIKLNSETGIVLEFDELGNEINDYSYTIIHCDANWKPSEISQSEYIDGMYDERIMDYAYSFNTFQEYIHYRVTIPNETMDIRASGNYIIQIYEDYDREKLVLTRRFCVAEDKVVISAQIKRPSNLDRRDSGHEIDFTLNCSGVRMMNPFNDIKVVISQNGRWDNAITGLKPLIVNNNELMYDLEEGNVFDAGSEFRFFDIKSIRYQSERISRIVYEKPYYHVQLVPDEVRTFTVYFFNQDMNGKYFPEIQEGEDNSVEADYVWVYFTLPYEAPMIDGNFYVFGGLSDWLFNKSNRMIYNFEKKAYRSSMLLKQGYYNYEYAFVKDGSDCADITFLEGSHYETENDYIIYVYHRDLSERFDRLVGVEIINSLRGN